MKIHSRPATVIMALALNFALMAALSSAALGQKRGREFITTPMAEAPVIAKMSDWQEYGPRLRYAFLIGFVTMLEMENEWQSANKPLAPKQSQISSWSAALKPRSLRDMYRAINNYAKNNPDRLEQKVTEVMWITLVQPTADKIENPRK